MTKLFVAVLLISQVSLAAKRVRVSEEMRRALQIGSISITEVSVPLEEQLVFNPNIDLTESAAGAVATLTAADVAVDKIISIGTKIWKVIESGQAVLNLASGNALPREAT